MTYIIFADFECLIKKIDGCANNSKKFLAAKTGSHILCRYSMLTI